MKARTTPSRSPKKNRKTSDALHSKDRKKAWARFNELADEMVKLGILEPGSSLRVTQEFQRRAIELLKHPITKEALEASEKELKKFFDACMLAALVSFYRKISPGKLQPRWEVINGLITFNGLKIFREQNR